MSELLREWIEQVVVNDAVMRETQLRLIIRDRPRWLPDRVWRWTLRKLLVLEELPNRRLPDLPAHNNQEPDVAALGDTGDA